MTHACSREFLVCLGVIHDLWCDDGQARVNSLAGSGVVGASISRIVVSTSVVVLIVVRSIGVGICKLREEERRVRERQRSNVVAWWECEGSVAAYNDTSCRSCCCFLLACCNGFLGCCCQKCFRFQILSAWSMIIYTA